MNKETTKTNATPAAAQQAQPQVAKVNTTNLKTSYCNMCSTNTTREEVVLNFGVNQNWDRPESPEVSLEHRIKAVHQREFFYARAADFRIT